MKKNPFVYYGKKALVFLLSVFILSVAVFYKIGRASCRERV